MNDLIVMAIKGGRYLEAESKLGDFLLNNPTDEHYFLMGSIKSNLILDKGRDISEVFYCFEKSQQVSENKPQAILDSGMFLYGIYLQLKKIETELNKNLKTNAIKAVAGVILTYASSRIIDDAKKSFGTISGIVGASFGIGMTLDGLEKIGDISAQLDYVSSIKTKIKSYLVDNLPIEAKEKILVKVDVEKLKNIINEFPNEFYTFEEITNLGKISDPTTGLDSLQNLGINFENCLFATKWHHQGTAALFYEDGIKAFHSKGVFSGYELLDLKYADLFEVIFKKSSDSMKLPYQFEFAKGTSISLLGTKEDINNFILGGKDKMGRDDSLFMKKVSVKGLFKSHDYSPAIEYFCSCFSISNND
jgi:hypothetical protein